MEHKCDQFQAFTEQQNILLTCTLMALSKSSCFLMRASTLSRESPLSSLARKASRAAIQFSACSQSLLKSYMGTKESQQVSRGSKTSVSQHNNCFSCGMPWAQHFSTWSSRHWSNIMRRCTQAFSRSARSRSRASSFC